MKDHIQINIVGDVCLKNITNNNYMFSDELLEHFKKANLNVANLECALTTSENALKYQPINLKAEPKPTKVFDCFDVYSLANNHTMDYGEEGLKDTISFLTESKKYYFGAGMCEKESLQPALIEIDNFKIAFFSFNRFNTSKGNKAGTAPEKLKTISNEIKKYKQLGYFVIVYPHWNYQWIDYPAPDERKKGYKMIDAGADIVIGAHPHIVQGYEKYKEKYIFHSLGNFVFRDTKYTKAIPQFGQSFVLNLIVYNNMSYSYNILPVFNNNDGARFMSESEKTLFMKRLTNISDILKDKYKSHLLFYQNGRNIEKNNKYVFHELKKDGGFRAIVENYKIANWQDIKRKIFTLLFK